MNWKKVRGDLPGRKDFITPSRNTKTHEVFFQLPEFEIYINPSDRLRAKAALTQSLYAIPSVQGEETGR
jgi:hypothetical protein